MPSAIAPPTLRGAGCLLRPWAGPDAAVLREACGDPSICRFTTVPEQYSPTAAAGWVRRQQERGVAGTAVVLAIVPPEEGPPVGMAGLFGLEDGDRTARLGYWLIARARRRGLASAAATMLTRWGFAELHLTAIFIDREPGNVASGRIAAGLGAVRIGARPVHVRGISSTLERYRLDTPRAAAG